jgi:hypothetical protein
MVPVGIPLPADSPRLGGENRDHIRLLADATAPLPPILVHRSTMRVIDGMHRLRAAMLRGATEIAVEFFDGTEAEAFARAVRENVAHGLPLSRSDREAAHRPGEPGGHQRPRAEHRVAHPCRRDETGSAGSRVVCEAVPRGERIPRLVRPPSWRVRCVGRS